MHFLKFKMRIFSKRRKDRKDKIQMKKKVNYFHYQEEGPEESIDYMFKIVLLGDSKEKPKLGDQFSNDFESETKLTIGVDFEVKIIEIDDIRVKFQIWDFSSEKRFQSLIPMYVRGASGGFFVYDMDNKRTTESIEQWITLIKNTIHKQVSFPLIAIGITPENEEEIQVSIDEGVQMAETHGLDGFLECQIRNRADIDQAFTKLVQLILKKKLSPLAS
jgi:GTPase SAR1 family protein